MSYLEKHILTENLGNNAFAWIERNNFYSKNPILTIPSLIEGGIEDVKI
jgi:hypothetical protein